jgi:hypothetical protein
MIIAGGGLSATAGATTVFTWDPAGALPSLGGSAFTADTIYGGHYLWDYGPSAPPFVAVPGVIYTVDFYEQIQQFSLGGGAPFVPSGLNGAPGATSSYGLYLKMQAQVEQVGAPNNYAYHSLSMQLMLDPENNNGTLSATQSGVGFSNTDLTGEQDDITLAAGSLVSGKFTLSSIPGIRSVSNFVETFQPAPGEGGFFVSPVSPYQLIEEALTTPASSFQAIPDPNNPAFQWSVLNDGMATIDLTVLEPPSFLLLGVGLAGLAGLRLHKNRPRPR